MVIYSTIVIPNIVLSADNDLVNINGNVVYDAKPVCAMVLANGQYRFACSGDGSFNFDVPLDQNGKITIQAFCSGLAPYRQTITSDMAVGMTINMEKSASDKSVDVSAALQAIDDGQCVIEGTVTNDGIPVCAMALANGQYEFTCSGDGSFDLNIPIDDNGQVTLYSFCSGFQPYKYVYTPEQISFSDDYDEDGYTIDDGDCNDMDPDRHPGATEICDDGIDQDCNDRDESCASQAIKQNYCITEPSGSYNIVNLVNKATGETLASLAIQFRSACVYGQNDQTGEFEEKGCVDDVEDQNGRITSFEMKFTTQLPDVRFQYPEDKCN
jgi:hypothetical protein